MDETLLKVLPINDLLGKKFFIPYYQRGYRWTPTQVAELLDDIWEFGQNAGKKEEFYCLQPLIVAERDNQWILIDGQQRLTTIYLILVYLKSTFNALYPQQKEFSIRYETRPDLFSFFENLNESKSCENADYFHIYQAFKKIEEWFNGKTIMGNFLMTLLNNEEVGKNVKVIWYNAGEEKDDNKYIEIFTRINVGKIPLTNSELIRALFLKEVKADTNGELKQNKIAVEWDEIEHKLQDDSFWYFIWDRKQQYENRIEYIFDLMKEKEPDHENYYTFHKFNEELKNNRNIEFIWLAIKKYFQTFEEWYNDQYFYHLIGYLITTGSSLRDLKSNAKEKTKTDFKMFLVDEIKKQLPDEIKSLLYNDPMIKRILLLFNILSILSNDKSYIRFPFDRYKKEDWDIEHIRSIKSDRPTGNKRKDWLEIILEYFTGEKESERQRELINSLQNSEEKEITQKVSELIQAKKIEDSIFDPLYEKISEHFQESIDPDTINFISNLTLLDSGTNRGYKNVPFPVKRKIIIEKNDKSGSFIPLCTKNVFLKYYSKKFETGLMFWSKDDADDYLSAIKATIHDFSENKFNWQQ